MPRPININHLMESRDPASLLLKEGIFSHLFAGIVGFLLGKSTDVKVTGTEKNVANFRQALMNMRKEIDKLHAQGKGLSSLAKRYNVKIIEK